jgi:hypothetical protein
MKTLLTVLTMALLCAAVPAFSVDPATVDPACVNPTNPYDPAIHGTYDATARIRFCTPYHGVDHETGDEVVIDDTIFELVGCELVEASSKDLIAGVARPGFGQLVVLTPLPARFIAPVDVELSCYLGRRDGSPIDPTKNVVTLKGEVASATARFRRAAVPAGILLPSQ